MTEHKKMMVLRLPPQEKDVYLVVPGDWTEYRVEEGQCPSDLFMNGVEVIIIDGDTDPHGLFELVRVVDRPEFLDRTYPGDEWSKVVPEAFEKK